MATMTPGETAKAIEEQKRKWAESKAAGDRAGMDAAHTEAERLRATVGFSGGSDGSKYIELSPAPAAAPVEAAPVAAETPAPKTGIQDFTGEIDNLTAAQKAQRIAALQRARDQTHSALAGEAATIAPQYYDKRNTEASTSELNKMNLAEYLAQRGMTGAGAAGQVEISRLGALQGVIGGLNRQEQAANDDIARRRTAADSELAWGITNAESELASQAAAMRLQELQRVQGLQLNQNNMDRSFDRGVFESDRSFDRSVVEGDRSYAIQKATSDAQIADAELSRELKTWQLEAMKDPNSPSNRQALADAEKAELELARLRELMKTDPERAALEMESLRADVNAKKASTAATWNSISNSKADNSRAENNADWDRFLQTWAALGRAPANSFGITEGSIYKPDMKEPTAPKPADVNGNRDTLIGGLMGEEVKGTDERGNAVSTRVQQLTPSAAMSYIKGLVSTGQITKEDANWLVESIPSLRAYVVGETTWVPTGR